MRINKKPIGALALVFALCASGYTKQRLSVGGDTQNGYVPVEANKAAREWLNDARFGMFIHWGVYAVPAKGEWLLQRSGMQLCDYKKYADQFNPTAFKAEDIVLAAKNAGMKYINITTRHHDGFAMWFSECSEWDIEDASPFNRDIIKEMAAACEKHGIKLFLYYSHVDWSHSDYYPRGNTGKSTGRPESGDFSKYVDYMQCQLRELLGGDYGHIAGVWFDGWWDQRDNVDWRLAETYDLIHELQPHALICNNHHGALKYGEDYRSFERNIPVTGTKLIRRKYGDVVLESCDTMNRNWSYKKPDRGYKSKVELIHYLINTAHCGANLLLNVGPKPDGTLTDGSVKGLKEIGEWMNQYSSTIYGTERSYLPELPFGKMTVRYGSRGKNDRMYLHVTDMPENGMLSLLGMPNLKVIKAYPFDNPAQALRVSQDKVCTQIDASAVKVQPIDTIIVVEHKPWQAIELPPLPATSVKAASLQDGLNYQRYKGTCNVVRELDRIEKNGTGTAAIISASILPSGAGGLKFAGYLNVPKTGRYTFYLTSADGSLMNIGGLPLISNDGLHGPEMKSATIQLEKGFHSILIEYFDAGGDRALKLEWNGPEFKKQVVADQFFKSSL